MLRNYFIDLTTSYNNLDDVVTINILDQKIQEMCRNTKQRKKVIGYKIRVLMFGLTYCSLFQVQFVATMCTENEIYVVKTIRRYRKKNRKSMCHMCTTCKTSWHLEKWRMENCEARHIRNEMLQLRKRCSHCEMTFSRATTMRRHIVEVHGETKYECGTCGKVFKREEHLKRHLKRKHPCTKIT